MVGLLPMNRRPLPDWLIAAAAARSYHNKTSSPLSLRPGTQLPLT